MTANVAEGFIGSKATISYWNVALSPDGYTKYLEVQSFGDVGETTPEIDKTTLDSDAVERRGGLPDPEKLTMMMNMTAANYAIVKAQKDAGTALDLKMDFAPTGVNLVLYVKFVPLELKINKVDPKKLLEVSFGGRMTGAISITDPHA